MALITASDGHNVFRAKWRKGGRLLVAEIPALRGGDFLGIGVYCPIAVFDGATARGLRTVRTPPWCYRLNEPTRLSLSMVASPQSPPPFRLAKLFYLG